MKTCPVCALDLEDTYLFCPDDGSSLGSPPTESAEKESASTPDSEIETPGAVVLYCPTCAAEYPLTFSECPVHHVLLTKHRIPRSLNGATNLDEYLVPGVARTVIPEPRDQRRQFKLARRLTTLDLERPAIESPKAPVAALTVSDEGNSSQPVALTETLVDGSPNDPVASSANTITPFDYREPERDVHEQGLERPGFRVAAIATVIALGVLAIVAMYKVISHLSRRPPVPVVQVAGKTEAAQQPLPFVATPQAAQDYQEAASVQPSMPQEPEPERQPERVLNQRPPAASERVAHQFSPAQTVPKPAMTASPAAPLTTRITNPPLPALPRGNTGGFDARLIRVRSRRTPEGFHYDLTFNMQEQAGRSAQWQRVLISTRTASGISHSQAIAFSHRLGATGALTFTIGVELTGRSEGDWQGRVVCTTLGWDKDGAPLQASFGANVTP